MIFGKELAKKLSDGTLNKRIFTICNVGPDIFFISSDKKIRDLGKKIQSQNIKIFLQNFYDEILKNSNVEYIWEYFYGMLAHYYLDSYTHPYIIYKTGVYIKNDSSSVHYYRKHQAFENEVDMLLYDSYILNKKDFIFHSNELKNFLNYFYKKYYNISFVGDEYFKLLYKKYFISQYIKMDMTGVKEFVYDTILGKCFNKTNMLYYTYHKNRNKSLLNLDRNLWYDPCDYKEHTESFMDLYNNALDCALNAIQNFDFNFISDSNCIKGENYKKQLKYFYDTKYYEK